VTVPPNHALQRIRPSRPGCKRAPSWAGSLSWGRYKVKEGRVIELQKLVGLLFSLKFPDEGHHD